jgi:hypothetical protein
MASHPRTRAQIWALLNTQPAYPDDREFGRWDADQLAAFIVAADADIAARPRPTKLDLNRLTPEQLARIATCESAAECQLVEQAILNNQPLPPSETVASARKADR